MIKEYLSQLLSANKEELKRLENQMNQLMNDLKCGEEWIENLQREQNIEQSIFSPRSKNNESQEKLETARENINGIKQKIEYTREMMEAEIKKKYEYEKLMEEAENGRNSSEEETMSIVSNFIEDSTTNTEDSAENNISGFENHSSAIDQGGTEKTEKTSKKEENSQKETDENSKKNGNETKKVLETPEKDAEKHLIKIETVEKTNNQLSAFPKEKVKEILSLLYKKTEICLALSSGDRNRCKNELKEMKRIIKEYAEQIEKE